MEDIDPVPFHQDDTPNPADVQLAGVLDGRDSFRIVDSMFLLTEKMLDPFLCDKDKVVLHKLLTNENLVRPDYFNLGSGCWFPAEVDLYNQAPYAPDGDGGDILHHPYICECYLDRGTGKCCRPSHLRRDSPASGINAFEKELRQNLVPDKALWRKETRPYDATVRENGTVVPAIGATLRPFEVLLRSFCDSFKIVVDGDAGTSTSTS